MLPLELKDDHFKELKIEISRLPHKNKVMTDMMLHCLQDFIGFGLLLFIAGSKLLIMVFDAKMSRDCSCIYFAANLWSHWQDDNIKGDLSLHKLISIWLTYLMYQNKQGHKVSLRCNANPGFPNSLAFLTPWQISNIHDLIIAPRPNIQDSRVSLKQNIHISVLAQKQSPRGRHGICQKFYTPRFSG